MNNATIISLLKEMKENCLKAGIYDDPKRNDKAEALNYAIFAVEKIEPKKGKWIQSSLSDLTATVWYECSECGKLIKDTVGINFCSKCGAYMRGEEDDN